ncbi:MAG TPA: hydrogen gas-evolving membrane-bound hydrogenase subunit E [Bryobacteraceae bacterium]|nr:hydrogen gas-evolving membrane-bound hydrogenase subunit E [Bryobacteraceae bacterium]
MQPLIALSPFLLAPLAVAGGRLPARWSALLAIWPAALAVYFGFLLQSVATTGPIKSSLPWAPSLALELSFYADGLSLLFAVIITAIGSLVLLFSASYFNNDPSAGRFFGALFAFMGSMLGVVLADNLLALFVFWELTGFTSFLLIGFNHDRKEARASAIQALLVTGTGGMGLLAVALLVEQNAGTLRLSALLLEGPPLRSIEAYPFLVMLALFAAFTKSAQVPFHFWLPNAMTAPTPVSAYLHSATMVKAGIYLVARFTPILGGTPLWTDLVVGAGAITMMLGAWRCVAETDLKRILAYSTISALGVIMMLLGIGTSSAVVAALTYLIAHACYKGALFLVAGTLEHETGTRDITQLGGLRHAMRATAIAAGLAACSMAGMPLFLGFTAKEFFYGALLENDASAIKALLAAAIAASALLGAAGLTAGVAPFTGPLRAGVARHKVPIALAAPPLFLATAGLVTGVLPGVTVVAVNLAASAVLGKATSSHFAIWHGFTFVLALSILTLAMAGSLYAKRDGLRRGIWPRSLGFERLYTSTLRGLDALSAWSSPALQGASLRAYVMTLVATVTVMLAGVLIVYDVPHSPSVTDLRPPEVAAALMIVGGALFAVRATTAITAVLSLGVTGYGAALTFLFFGAPDLAMTQFSVETLTAVIFVLVFYHFRSFGDLSPLRIRVRDAFVALIYGSSIAVVLLFVGSTLTPARLAGYFSESSLPLAYGRNIVNVILVDFRALDTLGEITVLATAALGVRAILRLGRRGGENQ